jgi:chromosome segregation ATPase
MSEATFPLNHVLDFHQQQQKELQNDLANAEAEHAKAQRQFDALKSLRESLLFVNVPRAERRAQELWRQMLKQWDQVAQKRDRLITLRQRTARTEHHVRSLQHVRDERQDLWNRARQFAGQPRVIHLPTIRPLSA